MKIVQKRDKKVPWRKFRDQLPVGSKVFNARHAHGGTCLAHVRYQILQFRRKLLSIAHTNKNPMHANGLLKTRRCIDYIEILSPMVKLITIRVVLELEVKKDLHLEQLVVKTTSFMMFWKKKFT